MNELHFAYKIRQHLNRGLRELSPAASTRLERARKLALARQKQAVPQSVLAAAGNFVVGQFDNRRVRQIGASLLVIAAIAGSSLWFVDQRISELSTLDSALLSDDLPMGVFTDKGFDAWLKNSPSR